MSDIVERLEKLTGPQRELMSSMCAGASLSYATLRGVAWSSDGRFTVKVRVQTLNSLFSRKLIEASERSGAVEKYVVTDAGRRALAQGEK